MQQHLHASSDCMELYGNCSVRFYSYFLFFFLINISHTLWQTGLAYKSHKNIQICSVITGAITEVVFLLVAF